MDSNTIMTHLLRIHSTLELCKIRLGIDCTKKYRLVLVHASIGEEQRWIREWNDRRRRDWDSFSFTCRAQGELLYIPKVWPLFLK